ncbi:hypothetical protein MAM1_0009c01008 [Mucor ambiguus]|uniref:Cryptic loci regulator 2 N-terminal domain-containing protein n=1 Tax=Mucor ambiguus TaxID=91626 RepID=A0A0C9LQM4_9FUNG|nr:hypothetical protein MAM1_0009c01008 [Mucor ambiguus]
MSEQPERTTYIKVKPPISDAVPPFKRPRKELALSKFQQQRVMETLGSAIYECRQKKKAKDPVILTALPRGYVVEFGTQYIYRGHPSSLFFHSTSAFLKHLLWLEAMSHPESIKLRRKCSCVVCTKIRDKAKRREAMKMPANIYSELTADSSSSDVPSAEEESSSSEPASPAPAASSPEASASRESMPDNSKTIRIYPLKKVLIERPVNPHYYYPKTFTIPLPKMQKSDESILLKSLRS